MDPLQVFRTDSRKMTRRQLILMTLFGIAVYWLIAMYVQIETANIHSNIVLRYPALTILSAWLGAVPGAVIGGCGQILFELASYGYLKIPTVIGTALLGLLVGLRKPERPIDYSITCAVTNIVVWLGLVPVLDVLMRGYAWGEAFSFGALHALFNALTCIAVGQIMHGSIRKTAFRKLVSVILIIDALLLFTYGRRGFGNIMVYAIATLLCLYSIFADTLLATKRKGWLHNVRIGVCVLLFAYLLSAVFLTLNGKLVTATGTEDAVIVLGAGLDGEEPNTILKERLDLAYDYAQAHPDVLIITSGGQGADEVIAEGEAMKRYLIRKGLPEERLIAETESTTTEENFAYSRRLVPEAESIVCITSDYHCFRAGLYAQIAGYKDPHQLGSATRFWSLIPSLAREVPSTCKLVVRCFVLWLKHDVLGRPAP